MGWIGPSKPHARKLSSWIWLSKLKMEGISPPYMPNCWRYTSLFLPTPVIHLTYTLFLCTAKSSTFTSSVSTAVTLRRSFVYSTSALLIVDTFTTRFYLFLWKVWTMLPATYWWQRSNEKQKRRPRMVGLTNILSSSMFHTTHKTLHLEWFNNFGAIWSTHHQVKRHSTNWGLTGDIMSPPRVWLLHTIVTLTLPTSLHIINYHHAQGWKPHCSSELCCK